MSKTCKVCGGNEFYVDKKHKNARCKNCQKKYMRKIYATGEYKQWHREAQRRYRTHGIIGAWKGKFIEQKRACAICHKKAKTENQLCADHNHKNHKARGFLCRSCNVGIGLFKDNPMFLKAAIRYLEKYQ